MNCPRCNSTQVKTKTYTGAYTYMGTWLHCKRCGCNTQIVEAKLSKGQTDEFDYIGENVDKWLAALQKLVGEKAK